MTGLKFILMTSTGRVDYQSFKTKDAASELCSWKIKGIFPCILKNLYARKRKLVPESVFSSESQSHNLFSSLK